MTKFRSLLVCAALALGLAVTASITACATPPPSDPSAATPASTHYKADLATGYDALELARVGVLKAAQQHVITVDQAAAVQVQCKAFTTTLDTLRAGAATSGNQTVLTATLLAISAATAYFTVTQGVPKS